LWKVKLNQLTSLSLSQGFQEKMVEPKAAPALTEVTMAAQPIAAEITSRDIMI
jgi:hypothetical protein